MAQRREAFFSLPALLLMAALMGAALYLLFPRQAIFEDINYLSNPDGLSIAYLEVLLRSDQDNLSLRINLGTMLARSGQPRKAQQTLAPLMERESIPSLAFETYTGLIAQQVFAEPPGPEREAVRQRLFETYQKLSLQNYDIERMLNLLRPANDWLTGDQYLAILSSLRDVADTKTSRIAIAREVARRQEATGDPALAVITLREVLPEVSEPLRAPIVSELIRLELAAGNATGALDLFRQAFASPPMTSGELARGMELARLAGDDRQYRRWLLQRARQEPTDIETQRSLLQLQLGEGELVAALGTVRRLQAIDGQLSRTDREQMARVLEWNNRPAEALSAWQSIYNRYGSAEAFRRIRALASSLFRWDVLASVLASEAAANRLRPDDYSLLSDALINIGDFEGAQRRLAEGLDRHPDASSLRARKLTLLINSRRFPEAIELLERSESLTDAERLQLANLYWRIREPDTALAQLNFESEDPDIAAEAAAMRLDLAVLLGRTDVLRQEYRQAVARDPIPQDAFAQERLLSLAVLFGEYDHAIALSNARFQATGEPRYLAARAEYHLILEEYDELEATLWQWRKADPDVTNTPRYWTLTASLMQQRGDAGATAAAFRRASALAPENNDILTGWAWFLISHPERQPGELPLLLQRLADSPGANTYPVLAYGYSALGEHEHALYWFREGLPLFENDDNWLVSMASALDQTGAHGTASDLRQQVAERMSSTSGSSDSNSRLAVYRGEHLDRLAWQEIARYQTASSSLDVNEGDYRQALAQLAIEQNSSLAAESLLRGDETARLYPDPAPLVNNDNRALQLGYTRQNLGNFTVGGHELTGQFSHDRFRWLFSTRQLEASGRGRLNQRPDSHNESRLELESNHSNLRLWLSAGQLERFNQTDTTAGLEVGGPVTDRISLTAGYRLSERTPDTAEAWWVTSRDRSYLALSYTPFSRLTLSAQAEQFDINELNGRTLATGTGLDLNATYTLFRRDPDWTVSAGYRNQESDISGSFSPETAAALAQPLGVPLTPEDLISREYERLGVSTRWSHGEPHTLFRSTPSPRLFLGLGTGFVLSTSTPDFNLEAGLGWRVLGDDELALSGRWSSENLDGNARTDVKLTYTLYFGH
ncbi:tetratricopeptide repeat protein [Marinobacter sp. M-5]|uniref:tetratricopeptide repeat protein n=1 Tax=Marinobacter sp. M-5 TaxID=3081089 RepID=UPI00293C54E0|nr:tetratricopeptide repeat protein [Marinobacter sp. M-5]MDV3504305.1 tetratricopeptide repeat protein [Marinobacter sp. M-5]